MSSGACTHKSISTSLLLSQNNSTITLPGGVEDDSSSVGRFTNGINNITIDIVDNVVDNSPRLSDVDISTSRGAQQAVLVTNKALEQINSFQAYAGASENRLRKSLELISKNLETAKISRGRIIDSDFAVETTQLAIAQIIMQSSQNIILQANTAKQNLLTLIE